LRPKAALGEGSIPRCRGDVCTAEVPDFFEAAMGTSPLQCGFSHRLLGIPNGYDAFPLVAAAPGLVVALLPFNLRHRCIPQDLIFTVAAAVLSLGGPFCL
jgi:hypothetical protein